MKTRIKELRHENQLTQESLASQIGITQAALSRIECEISIPDAALLVRLSDIFQVSIDYILYLSDQRNAAFDSAQLRQSFQTIISSLTIFNSRQRWHLQNFLESILSY